jgi:threonine/homoserine/homoserine lactone efflux protein
MGKERKISFMFLFLFACGLAILFCAPPGAITAQALRRGFVDGFKAAFLLEVGSLVGDATWAISWFFIVTWLSHSCDPGKVGIIKYQDEAGRL